MKCSLIRLNYVFKIFSLNLLFIIGLVNFEIAEADGSKYVKDLLMDFDYLVSQLYVQHCTFVEIGEGVCSLFVELTLNEGYANSCRKPSKRQMFFGNCLCEEFRNWHLCSFQLTNQRREDCQFKEGTSCPKSSARVHRRLCDVTGMSQWNPQCNCSVHLNGVAQNPMCGFKTCYMNPMPKSICGPRTVCGTDHCDVVQHGSLYSVKCDRRCKDHQPFCEHLGPGTSLKPTVKSEWSEWRTTSKADRCNILQYEAECLSEWKQPAFDCLGPGLLCCGKENVNCICEVKQQDGRLKAFRYVISDRNSKICARSKKRVRSAILRGDPKVWSRLIGISLNESGDSLSMFARPLNINGQNEAVGVSTQNRGSSQDSELISDAHQKQSHQFNILTNNTSLVFQSNEYLGGLNDKFEILKTMKDTGNNASNLSETISKTVPLNKNELFGLKSTMTNSTHNLTNENQKLNTTNNQLSKINNSSENENKNQSNPALVKGNDQIKSSDNRLLTNNSHANQTLKLTNSSLNKSSLIMNENKNLMNKKNQKLEDKQTVKESSDHIIHTTIPTAAKKTENLETNSKQHLNEALHKNVNSNIQSNNSTGVNDEHRKSINDTHDHIFNNTTAVKNSQNISSKSNENKDSSFNVNFINEENKQLFDILQNSQVINDNNNYSKNQSLSNNITKSESVENNTSTKELMKLTNNVSAINDEILLKNKENDNRYTWIDITSNNDEGLLSQEKAKRNKLREDEMFHGENNLNIDNGLRQYPQFENESLKSQISIKSDEKIVQEKNRENYPKIKHKTKAGNDQKVHVGNNHTHIYRNQYIPSKYENNNQNQTIASKKDKIGFEDNKEKKNLDIDLKKGNLNNFDNIDESKFSNQEITVAAVDEQKISSDTNVIKSLNEDNIKNHIDNSQNKEYLQNNTLEKPTNFSSSPNITNVQEAIKNQNTKNSSKIMAYTQESGVYDEDKLSKLVIQDDSHFNDIDDINDISDKFKSSKDINKQFQSDDDPTNKDFSETTSQLAMKDVSEIDNINDINDKMETSKDINKDFQNHGILTNKDEVFLYTVDKNSDKSNPPSATPQMSQLMTEITQKQSSISDLKSKQHGISINIQITTPNLIEIIEKDFFRHNEDLIDQKDTTTGPHNNFYDEPEPVLKDLNKVGKEIDDEKLTNALTKVIGLNKPSGKIIWSEVSEDKGKNNPRHRSNFRFSRILTTVNSKRNNAKQRSKFKIS